VSSFVDYTLTGLSYGLLYAAVALSLVLIWRATHVVNFAQGTFATITTYIALAVVDSGAGYWAGFVTALAAGAALGAVTERLLVARVEGRDPLSAVVLTIGLLVAGEGLVGLIWGAQERAFPAAFSQVGLSIGRHHVAFSRFDLFTLAAVIGAMACLGAFFKFSRLGLRMRASALDPTTSRLLGVRVGANIALGWAMATALGALTGLLIAPKVFLSPPNMEVPLIYGFTAAVLGGLDSAVGAVVGGVVTGLAVSYVGGYLGSSLEPTGALALLLAVLIARPQGLFAARKARGV
jgi:branched-chain amino acid transport system permease protein